MLTFRHVFKDLRRRVYPKLDKVSREMEVLYQLCKMKPFEIQASEVRAFHVYYYFALKYPQDGLWNQHDPGQDKVITEDGTNE